MWLAFGGLGLLRGYKAFRALLPCFVREQLIILAGCVNTKPTSLPEGGIAVGFALGGLAYSVGARLWLTPHTKIDAQADIFTFIPLEKA